MKLTIAIPTYNRKKELKATLLNLKNQKKFNEIQLIIMDNKSSYNIIELVKDIGLNEKPNVLVIKNKYNVGMSANFIKCFEYCNTKWMWLLGDDDIPSPNIIEKLLRDLENKNCLAIKYSYSYQDTNLIYKKNKINGLNELMNLFEEKNNVNFANFLFISNFIFRTEKIKDEIKVGYENTGTYAPHIAMLLKAIENNVGSIILFSDKNIVKNNVVSYEEKWSRLTVGLGISGLLNMDFNMTKESRQNFINSLAKFINIKETFIETLNEINTKKSKLEKENYKSKYKKIYKLLIQPSKYYMFKYFYYITLIILATPKNSFRILNAFFKIQKNEKIKIERL